MSPIRTVGRRTVMAAAAALAAPATARAQAYPARTVRVVNAYSPGGTADVICRATPRDVGRIAAVRNGWRTYSRRKLLLSTLRSAMEILRFIGGVNDSPTTDAIQCE